VKSRNNTPEDNQSVERKKIARTKKIIVHSIKKHPKEFPDNVRPQKRDEKETRKKLL
jgi:hypothetical protein